MTKNILFLILCSLCFSVLPLAAEPLHAKATFAVD